MKIQLKNKEITIRKWKGKDKREFIKLMQEKTPNEVSIMNALVYDCIEEDVTLSPEEFKYVLSQIRAKSLGEEITYNFYCTECGETHERKYNISDIMRPVFEDVNFISHGGINITLGEIKNKEYYLNKIQEGNIYDFLLRIEDINGNDAFDLDYLIDFFDDLDIDVLDEILKQYDKIKFKIDDVNTFECDCGFKEDYKFDEIPEFFPSDWFNDDSIMSSFK